MAAKRRNTTFWSATQLKIDSDIPAQADIVVGANYIDCSNISLNAVSSLLSAIRDLYTVCNVTHTFVAGGETGKINAWARYKPGEVSYNTALPTNCYDNPTFTYTAPASAGAYLGDFAGYNHSEDTRPVWWASPHSSGQVVYSTIEIKGGLGRGKLGPLLGSGPEDETYWSRVKVQSWLSVNSGAYSYIGLSGYIDLSEMTGEDATLLYTMGSHGETAGNDYTLCLRPIYMDVDGTTPLAVCEGGVEVITYRIWGTPEDIAGALSITVNSIDTQEPIGGNPTTFTYDFDVNNDSPTAMSMAVRLHAEDNDAWFDETYLLTSEVTIPSSGSENFVEATGIYLPATLYAGTFRLAVEISVDSGATWTEIGSLGEALQHWQSLP